MVRTPSPSTPCFQLHLFGLLELRMDSETELLPLSLPGGKVQSLLACVFLYGGRLGTRRHIRHPLWPDTEPERA